MIRVVALVALAALVTAACGPGLKGAADVLPKPASSAPCAGLAEDECGRAQGLLRAASAFSNVKHEVLLDAQSTMVPGRGIEKREDGAYGVLPTRCAQERTRADAPKIDPSTIDFSYIGVAIDQRLVAADADLTPFVSVGAEASEKKISLLALAFVRDLDPQFFGASEDVTFGGSACSCGRATHFVGAVKMGGLLSFEMRVRAGELHGRAIEFVKARIAAGDARITQTSVGGLEIDGLDTSLGAPTSAAAKPLGFRVKTPVPIAYAIYPLADVCKFSFPAPEVSPALVELGDVPYGQEGMRMLHVVNRAPIDLRASLGDRTFAIPALGSADVPFTWTPLGQALGCEMVTREDTLQFWPRDEGAPVTPKTQSVKITARARTGKPTFTRSEHVDTGVSRKPDYAGTRREFQCPKDYALSACRTEKAQCGDGRCATDGYAVNAEPIANGCRFGCRGPEGLLPALSSNFCRFDAVMDCRLRCQ